MSRFLKHLQIHTYMWILVFTVSGVLGGAAVAQESTPLIDAATAHHQLAVQFFESQQYEAARIEWEAALALSKTIETPDGRPGILFNLAVVAEKQGRLDVSRAYALRFQATLRRGEKDPALDQLLVRVSPQAAEPASAAPVSVAIPKSTKAPNRRTGPWVVGGFGVVCLLSAVVLGVVAAKLGQDVESAPITSADLQAAQAKGSALNGATIGLLAGGLALTAGGGLWLGLSYRGQHSTP